MLLAESTRLLSLVTPGLCILFVKEEKAGDRQQDDRGIRLGMPRPSGVFLSE